MDGLPEIALSVARLTRDSLAQKKWQTEFRDRLAAAAEAIRREILGVAG